MARYGDEYRGPRNRGYDAGWRTMRFRGGAYDRPFRQSRQGRGYGPEPRGYGRDYGRPTRYDRMYRSGAPMEGGMFDPFTGPLRPDRGITDVVSGGRPNFFIPYGGGSQTGNRGRGILP